MFEINEMPDQLPPNIVERLSKLDIGTIGHFLDYGFMEPRIRQQMPSSSVVGTAITVRSHFPDSVIGHYALKFIRPGDILVIDRGDNKHVACWGGTTSLAAKKLGLTALIIDGACNDICESNAIDLPIWSDGVVGITTKYRAIGGGLNVTITCGGVVVNPGDAVMADENGVLIIPRESVQQVVDEGEDFKNGETAFRKNYEGEGPFERYPDLTGATDLVEAAVNNKHTMKR